MKRKCYSSVISLMLLIINSLTGWAITSNIDNGQLITIGFPTNESQTINSAYPPGVYNVTTSTSYPNLQDAINAAANGNLISCGTATTYPGANYSGSGSITVINTSGGIINIQGSSPALTIIGPGSIKFDGFSFNGVTSNDPTIRIDGGSLILRNSTIIATVGFARSAIQISATGYLDAGLMNDFGKNTFICDNDSAINNTTLIYSNTFGNWWGDASGPTNASNPGGIGYPISNYIYFNPFSTNSGFTSSNVVDIGLFIDTQCGDFVIKLKPGTATNGNLTGIVFTIRWAAGAGYDQDLQNIASPAPFTGLLFQQGPRITTGGYNYVTFAGIPNISVNWTAGVEIPILSFSVTGSYSGTITFEVMNDTYTNSNNKDYSIDVDGIYLNGCFYHQAINAPSPAAWTDLLTAQCISSTIYTLSGGTPTPGIYSGPGVTGTNFDASASGSAGTHTLTYTYTDAISGCVSAATNSILVNALPVVTWSSVLTPQCISNTVYTLTGGLPAGGTYSGSGISGTNFDASASGGAGTKTLTFTYTEPSTGCTNTATNTVAVSAIYCGIYIKAILQGAYDNTIHAMRTDLQSTGVIPANQPFNTAPWNYAGTEQHIGAFPSNVVDWVLVELRDNDHLTSVTRKAALLLNNGSVADFDGSVPLYMNGYLDGHQYYVTIYHRNHIIAMTASAVSFPNSILSVFDFTTDPVSSLWGGANATILLEPGKYGMIAGDINNDNLLIYSGPSNDRGTIIDKIGVYVVPLYLNSITYGYFDEDVTMNDTLKYSGAGNDQGIIFANIDQFTDPSFLNTIFTGQVPLNYAKSSCSSAGTQQGPVDILLKETSGELKVVILTNELIKNSFIDNIQFCLSWNQNYPEIQTFLDNYTSDYGIEALGPPVKSEGKYYQTFGVVDWKLLPENFYPNSELTMLRFQKVLPSSLSKLISISNDNYTKKNNATYYISVAGHDFTGTILQRTSHYTSDNSLLVFPNPSLGGIFNLTIDQPLSANAKIVIRDITSRIVFEEETPTSQNNIKLDLSHLSNGVYHCIVNVNEEILYKIIIKD